MGLNLSDISLSFGSKSVIDRLSLSAEEGQIVCLLGPSGCGKTTTLRVLAGLESPDHGVVSLDGRVVQDKRTNVPPERRRIGYLFQDFALFPHLNVKRNIGFGIEDRKDYDIIVQNKLEMVNMTEYAEAMPHMLSGGQQQRVALARAMATSPSVLLLDEPFSGLDATLRSKLRSSTYEILRRNKVTTVMVTHDPEEAMFMADIIALMDGGRIIQSGPPSELYSKPETEFCANFFGDVVVFEGLVRAGMIETNAGHFPTSEYEDGTSVRVLIRPESLKLIPLSDDGVASVAEGTDHSELSPNNAAYRSHFEIISIQFLGDKTLVTLADRDTQHPNIQVVSWSNISSLFQEGDRVSLSAHQDDLLLVSRA